MKIPGIVCAAAMIIGLFLLVTPASAHHSFAAEWDGSNCREFTGILTKLDWQNPHPYFYADIKNAAGKVESNTFQLSSPSNLKRGGAKYSVLTENIGKTVVIRGCASRNGTDRRYAGEYIKLADGTVQRTGQDVEGIFGTAR